jgi:hypothetical protein
MRGSIDVLSQTGGDDTDPYRLRDKREPVSPARTSST